MSIQHPTLGQIASLAEEVGAVGLRKDAEALAQRLVEGRFYVACLGQAKRGKSTLINALVGTAVLPTGVAPVTSAVTVVRHGNRSGARVRTANTDWQDIAPETLADYVTEQRNPGNVKGVTGIEVFAPTPDARAHLQPSPQRRDDADRSALLNEAQHGVTTSKALTTMRSEYFPRTADRTAINSSIHAEIPQNLRRNARTGCAFVSAASLPVEVAQADGRPATLSRWGRFSRSHGEILPDRPVD